MTVAGEDDDDEGRRGKGERERKGQIITLRREDSEGKENKEH